jgi:FtsH-binding integral membrane protein
MLSIVLNLLQYGSLDARFDAEVKKVEDNKDIPANQKKEQIDLLNKLREWVKVGLLPYLGVVGLVSLLILLGGVKLMTLSSPGLVTFGAVLSFLPCVSGCCLLGLVFGIWAMIAMSKPEVKAGFAARRRASYSPDSY